VKNAKVVLLIQNAFIMVGNTLNLIPIASGNATYTASIFSRGIKMKNHTGDKEIGDSVAFVRYKCSISFRNWVRPFKAKKRHGF
jgi:hypothetical protein